MSVFLRSFLIICIISTASFLSINTNYQYASYFVSQFCHIQDYSHNRIARILWNFELKSDEIPIVHLGGSTLYRGVLPEHLDFYLPRLKSKKANHLILASKSQEAIGSLDILENLVHKGFKEGVVIFAWTVGRLNDDLDDMLIKSASTHQFPWLTPSTIKYLNRLKNEEIHEKYRKKIRTSFGDLFKEFFLIKADEKEMRPLIGQSILRKKIQKKFYDTELLGLSNDSMNCVLRLNTGIEILEDIAKLCQATNSELVVIETSYHSLLDSVGYKNGLNLMRSRIHEVTDKFHFASINTNDIQIINDSLFHDYNHVINGLGQKINSDIYIKAAVKGLAQISETQQN